MKHLLRYLYFICIFIYMITILIALVMTSSLLMCLVAGFLPVLLPLLAHHYHYTLSYEIKIINLVFMYFASLIGSCLGGYSWPYYDKMIHFVSGMIISVFAGMLYCLIKKQKEIIYQKDRYILYIFITSVNLSIALFWEFYEYAMLIFFNNDCIRHYTTGVHDSITDMFCAFAGGFIILYQVISYHQKQHHSGIIKMMHQFYDQNVLSQKE